MITIEELNDKFIKREYFIEDKLLWWTYTNIIESNNGEISALGLFGPSGTGKTAYVKLLKDVLSEVLKEDVKLISFLCNYDSEETMVASDDAPKNVINKELMAKAIDEANKESKVILFIDGYDKTNKLTDLYIAHFLQGGIIKDSNNLTQLQNKSNLQVIIAGNDINDISDPLQKKLDIIKTSYMDSTKVLDYLYSINSRVNSLVVYLIVYLYDELILNDFTKQLPSIHEITKLLKNVQFLIESKAPISVISELIKGTMLKHISDYKKFYDEHPISKLTELIVSNRDKFALELSSILNCNSNVQKVLLSELINKPIELVNNFFEIKSRDKKNFSLISALEEDMQPIGKNKLGGNGTSEFDNIEWVYNNLIDKEKRKWFKVCSIIGANSLNVDKRISNMNSIKEGVLLQTYSHPNTKNINYLLIQQEESSLCNLSIYNSIPIMDFYIMTKLIQFIDLINFHECRLKFAIFFKNEIKDETILFKFKEDLSSPNIYYYSGRFDNELFRDKPFYNKLSNIEENKKLIAYIENKNFNIVIPTSTNNKSKEANFKLYRNTLKIGKVNLCIRKTVNLSIDEFEFFKMIAIEIEKFYNDKFKVSFSTAADYAHSNLFPLDEDKDYNRHELQKGIYIVNEGTSSEFLLINPFTAFFDIDDHKNALCDANKPFVKRLMN